MTEDRNIMVSIWCQTYNHKDYIRDALEGFVSQKADFAFEVIVYDDASTDGTSDIVREYGDKYPELFRVIIAEENAFQTPEKHKKLREDWPKCCRGKYLGLCEGDDYWIDSNKLQIQVNYMESHPECIAYFHNALRLDCRDSSMKAIDPYECSDEKELTPEELIMLYRGHPPTASFLLRREVTLMPDFFIMAPVGDYTMELCALTKGSVHYSSRIMSVYRFFRPQSYTDMVARDRIFSYRFYFGMTSFLLQYDRYTEYKYHVWITNRIQSYAGWFVYSIKSDQELMQFYDQCKSEGYLLEPADDECMGKIRCLRDQTFEKSYYAEETKKFVDSHKNIILMGIGKYCSILTEQFANNNVDFAGYAVSQKKDGDADEFMGKPVWTLSEIPFAAKETGVIVAINPTKWEDILLSLERAGIENYFCPFLLDKEADR